MSDAPSHERTRTHRNDHTHNYNQFQSWNLLLQRPFGELASWPGSIRYIRSQHPRASTPQQPGEHDLSCLPVVTRALGELQHDPVQRVKRARHHGKHPAPQDGAVQQGLTHAQREARALLQATVAEGGQNERQQGTAAAPPENMEGGPTCAQRGARKQEANNG